MKPESVHTSMSKAAFKRGRTLKTHTRYRDAGALYAHQPDVDLVQFKTTKDGVELWGWAERNRDPHPDKQGRPWCEASSLAEGQLVPVYDPDCPECPGDLTGCHFCHETLYGHGSSVMDGMEVCMVCGRGCKLFDRLGWPSEKGPVYTPEDRVARAKPSHQYYSNPEDIEADLDKVPLGELAEHGDMPHAVAMALVEWRQHLYGYGFETHYVATFLDTLAESGYVVTKIEAPSLDKLLPAPEGNQP